MLEATPSADVRRGGGFGGPTFLSLRGSESWHVRVTLDGIPLNGPASGSFDLGAIPVELLSSATIWRSNAPVWEGAPLPGGHVALESAEAGEPAVIVSGGGGSLGARSAAASVSARPGPVELLAVASYAGAENDFTFFDDNQTPLNFGDDDFSRRVNAHVDQGAGLVRIRARPGGWRLDGLTLFAAENGGVPGLGSVQARSTSLATTRGIVGLRARRPGALGERGHIELLGSFAVDRVHWVDLEREVGPGKEDERRLSTSSLVRAHLWGWPRDPIRLDLVVDVLLDTTRHRDVWAYYGERHQRETVGMGAQIEWTTWQERLRLVAAHRSDWIDDVSDPLNDTFSGPSIRGFFTHAPSFGVAVDPVATDRVRARVFANAAAGTRAPSFLERFGDRGATVGNAALRAESRRGWEAGAEVAAVAGPLRASGSYAYFARRMRDLIAFIDVGLGYAVPRNLDEATMRGHELAAALTLASVVTLRGHYARLDAQHTTLDSDAYGAPLPRRARDSGGVALEAAWRWIGGAWRVDAAGVSYADERGGRPIPPRVTHAAELRFDLPLPWEPRIVGQLSNVLNARVEDVELPDGGATVRVPRAIADFAGSPLPGRTGFVTLSLRPGAPGPRAQRSGTQGGDASNGTMSTGE